MACKTFTIEPAMDGLRAETVLRRYMPQLQDADVRNIFSHRDVKLDGVRIRPDTRVHSGQTVTVYYMQGEKQALDIIYEDDDVLLVNKRPGISVEPDNGGGTCMTQLALEHVGGSFPPVPCHRLDNQTCGLLLFAKNATSQAVLEDVFRKRTLNKLYTCLVRGTMKPPEAVCKAYLVKNASLARVTVYDHEVPGSKVILTEYRTMASEGQLSRLEVHLITGRTHQIRAHMAALGHPLLGDDLYGDRAFNRLQHAQGKLRLCASSLCLDTQGRLPQLDGVVFTAPCPF